MNTQIEDLIITLVEEEEMRVVEDVEEKLIQQAIDLSSNCAINMVIQFLNDGIALMKTLNLLQPSLSLMDLQRPTQLMLRAPRINMVIQLKK